MRNSANLVITLLVAPVLALLIGFVLRYSESGHYDFASAYHIPVYLFLSLIVAMFLGLTNSVDDIIRDRAVLLRERNLNVRLGYYVLAKVLTLAAFAVIQCILFTLVGNRSSFCARRVLDRFLGDVSDDDERSGDWIGHLGARHREEDGRSGDSRRPDSADHYGGRADQVRGHESRPRLRVFDQTMGCAASRKRDGTSQRPEGAFHLRAHANALVLRGPGVRPSQTQSAHQPPGEYSSAD